MVQKRERPLLDLTADADFVTRKIGIGIFGFVFGLFISVVLLSLIGDWLIGRGLELIGASIFAWIFINKSTAASIQLNQPEQGELPGESSSVLIDG